MKKRGILIIIVILVAKNITAQAVSTVDIVQINTKYEKEAMFFFEQNWLAFRKEALKEKIIKGYKILRSETDSLNFFNLTLITTYKDENAYSSSEENFRPIMRAISPGGPKYLNAIKREVFLKYITGSNGKVIFSE